MNPKTKIENEETQPAKPLSDSVAHGHSLNPSNFELCDTSEVQAQASSWAEYVLDDLVPDATGIEMNVFELGQLLKTSFLVGYRVGRANPTQVYAEMLASYKRRLEEADEE